jgi:hypothetical protein
MVLSLITSGHAPAEWWIVEPGRGHASSTERIREAPTTQAA